MKIPEGKHTISAKIDKWYEDQPQKVRFHLGASGLGHDCERKIWMDFRWAKPEQFPGRVLRLFERGQNEEGQIVKWLKSIGVKLTRTEEDQVFLDIGCHVGGSIDGLIEGGTPGAEKSRAILEIKTHNKKSFEELLKKGVKEAKPMHWVQMNTYAYASGIDRMLYFAVCKDDDRIYTEWLHLDQDVALKSIEKGQRLATQDEMPPPLSENPSWYQCKWCNLHGFCHGEDEIKNTHCRVCRYATACDDGTWYCEHHGGEIAPEYQVQGCKAFELHDHMVKE